MVLLAATSAMAQPESLNSQLQPYLQRYNLPALAAAVVKEGRIVAAGAVGTRRADADIPVTINDRIHLGSDTKAMTALLAAMAVEQGLMRWDSTPGQVFPELTGQMDPGFRDITLEKILSHTSGLPGDSEKLIDAILIAQVQEGNLDELRYGLISQICKEPLAYKPGAKFQYSNLGYILAGAMIERGFGSTWEELVSQRVFDPLELTSAGLGPQSSLGRTDAPLGHVMVDGKLKPLLAGPFGDVPVLLGPAGIAHMSILDFARWAGWNAGQGRRGPALVSADTLKKMHTPVIHMPTSKEPVPGRPSGGGYGLGWGQLQVSWAPEPLIYHGGSNTKNLAHIWLDPKRDLAIVTATNVAGQAADEALFNLAPQLYQKFAPK